MTAALLHIVTSTTYSLLAHSQHSSLSAHDSSCQTAVKVVASYKRTHREHARISHQKSFAKSLDVILSHDPSGFVSISSS